MKRFLSLLLLVAMSLTLVACKKKKVVESDEATVYFYAYRDAYTQDINHPDILRQQTYKKGELIEEPEEPVRSGYMFVGWYKDVALRYEWDFDADVIEQNTTLYAKWLAGFYRINLELNGGHFPVTANYNGEYDEDEDAYYYVYESGVSQTLHIPKKTGYKFLGWFKSEVYKKGDRAEYSVDRTIAEETTYYAHWELLRIVIRFDVNLETAEPANVLARSYDYGQTNDFPELVDTTGVYQFIGWNTRRDGTGDMLINGEPFEREQNTMLYAQWQEK